jgi:hypothetical protein
VAAYGGNQTVVICTPSNVTRTPCPSGSAPATVQAYLLNPSSGPSIEAQNADFDYAAAATIWSMAFTFVVGLYLVSKSAGTILSAIKSL